MEAKDTREVIDSVALNAELKAIITRIDESWAEIDTIIVETEDAGQAGVKIQVQGSEIRFLQIDQQDYISLTDITKHKTDDSTAAIGN